VTTRPRWPSKEADRVRIVGAHPWRGHSGAITGPIPPGLHGLDWIVDLPDVLMTAGAGEKNLRPVN
jgi:hypothetical protein